MSVSEALGKDQGGKKFSFDETFGGDGEIPMVTKRKPLDPIPQAHSTESFEPVVSMTEVRSPTTAKPKPPFPYVSDVRDAEPNDPVLKESRMHDFDFFLDESKVPRVPERVPDDSSSDDGPPIFLLNSDGVPVRSLRKIDGGLPLRHGSGHLGLGESQKFAVADREDRLGEEMDEVSDVKDDSKAKRSKERNMGWLSSWSSRRRSGTKTVDERGM